VIEAEFALVAEIRDAPEIAGAEFLRVPIYRLLIEANKQIVERRAEVIAAATPVADVEDAPQFDFNLRLIPE